jgi:hypothetical protein
LWLAFIAIVDLAFRMQEKRRHRVLFGLSELNTQPACASANASPAASRLLAHDWRSRWIATPSSYGSFIRSFSPVYPGALLPSCLPDKEKTSSLLPRSVMIRGTFQIGV